MNDLEFFKNYTPKYKRARTMTVIQMQVVECGAASLSMILSYYKKYCTLEELRIVCGVSSNGVRATDIIAGARTYGLEGKGFKKDIPALVEMKPPFIVYWDFKHFLVLEGFSKKGIFLNDPGGGPRLCSFQEFCEKYTGIIISFTPTADFKPGGRPPSVLHALRKRVQGIEKDLIFICLCQACLLIPSLATIAFTQIFIDEIFMARHLDWVGYFILAMLLSMGVQTFLTWIQGKVLYLMNAKAAIRLSSEFFFHILKLPLNFYQQRSSGDLAFRLQLNDTVVNVITQQISKAALGFLLIGVYGSLLFFFNPWLGLISLSNALINTFVLIRINRKRTDAAASILQKKMKTLGISIGGLQSMDTIKSLGMESTFFSKFSDANTAWLVENQNFGQIDVVLSVIVPLINSLTTTVMMGVGAILVINGELMIGQLMALQLISNQFTAPIQNLVGLVQSLQQTKVNLLRLDDSLNNSLDPRFIEKKDIIVDAQSMQKLSGEISIVDVSFGYSKAEEPVIQQVSLEVSPGKLLAIVGPADAGKSTLASLLAGLYEPWEGKILYDQKTREELPTPVLKSSLMIIDDKVHLFTGSIKDNITLWNADIPDEYLIEAAKDACVHDLIMLRDQGYAYEMREGGTDFSQGERQCLEIARALIHKPSILIFDEALGPLDIDTQKRIIRSIRRRGCSCLLMTNDLGTIALCDEIVVFEGKTFTQRGTHSVLQQEPGFYRDVLLSKGKSL